MSIKSLFVVTFPSHASQSLTSKYFTKEFKLYTRMHHFVTDAVLISYYSTMSHGLLILYYHAPMLTLKHLINITGTLVATSEIRGRLRVYGSLL